MSPVKMRYEAVDGLLNSAADAVDAVMQDIYDRSQQIVPVRQARPGAGRTKKAAPIAIVKSTRGLTRDQRQRRIELLGLSARELAREATPSDLPFFRIAAGEDKGKPVDEFVKQRGFLRGKSLTPGASDQGGTLKKSGHIETAKWGDGTIVRGRVKYSAPYALYVHEGFHHHPDGTLIKGRKFLREPLEEKREAFNSGAYFRKR